MAKKNTANSNQPITLEIGPQITVATLNRQREDIGKWRTAIQSAENRTNPKRTQLYTLYNDILLDAHLKSVWQKRKLAILNRKIKFTKNGKEDENAKLIISKVWFSEMLEYIIDAKLWGHSLIEFGMAGSEIGSAELIERRNVIPERGLVLLQETDTTGLPFRELPWSNYVLEVGKPNDLGLLLEAAPYVLYKRGTIGDWAQFNEVFGMPFRKYTYDGHDDTTRIILENAAKNAGSAGWAVLPKDSNLEFITNSSNSGSKDTYLALAEFCNKELSKLILGNTMTTEDGASKSQGEVHERAEGEIKEADKLWTQSVLGDDARRVLVGLGYSVFADGDFEVDEPESIDTKLARDIKLAGVVDIDPAYWIATYDRPVIGLKKTSEPLGKPKGTAV